jgi:hypothetical protein
MDQANRNVHPVGGVVPRCIGRCGVCATIRQVPEATLPFLVASQGGGGIAHGAHIGGFVAGLAAAFVMGRQDPGPSRLAPELCR